jgi:formylglycine-generating enzyme required for sulfatase activity
MTRLPIVMLAACSSPPSHPMPAVSAPLSLAADVHMIVIPAGRFISGSTPEERAAAYDDYRATAGHDAAREHQWFDSEDERHVVPEFPAYRIDLMPVTQAAYAEFVSAGGATAPAIDEAAWKAQHLAQDYATQVARFVWHDGRPPAGREEHPVVLVTWAEAAGYCKWRGELAGDARHLPSSEEYEKAARGQDGLAYPWGNAFEPDKLDSAVQGPKDTVPVGGFAAGASPFGVFELAGNVFEWTETPFGPGEMMVKGSAWEDFGGLGRGASRHGRPVGIRHVIVGFRCAGEVKQAT